MYSNYHNTPQINQKLQGRWRKAGDTTHLTLFLFPSYNSNTHTDRHVNRHPCVLVIISTPKAHTFTVQSPHPSCTGKTSTSWHFVTHHQHLKRQTIRLKPGVYTWWCVWGLGWSTLIQILAPQVRLALQGQYRFFFSFNLWCLNRKELPATI